jgi:GAF domain-containing protein
MGPSQGIRPTFGDSMGSCMPQETSRPRRSTGDFARLVQAEPGATARLQRGVELVVQLVADCDHAGVTARSQHQLMTVAASDPLVREGDAWQYELNQGPCLDAVRREQLVISQDLTHERRWTLWTRRVVDRLSVHAMMSAQLYTHANNFGALNLYADRSMAWDHRQVAIAQALAGQLAVAIADAVEIETRGRAIDSRTVIGQAQGILMERYAISSDRAFEYLRRISQVTNRKLGSIAADLVQTGKLPELPGSANEWTPPLPSA